MPAQFNLWWQERTSRERWLLALMFGLLFLVAAWLFVARPLMIALEEAKLRHGQAVIAVAEARAEADRASRPAEPRSAPALPIDALVSRTANEAGFTGARIIGRGPARASVAIDAARAEAYFAWIAALEGQGVTIESLRATANPDRTLSTQAVVAVGER